MMKMRSVLAVVLACGGALLAVPASAQCVVPNTLTNGQVADATEVMENFDALADCVDAVDDESVETTGTPTSGEFAAFRGPVGRNTN